jgi:hypothetical protein
MFNQNDFSSNQLDLVWLAGFIDGEGSLITKLNKNHYEPKISITNTHFPTKEKVKDILTINNLEFYERIVREGKIQQNGVKHRNSWELEAQGHSMCHPWLELLLPHLKTKQEQGQLLLNFIQCRTNKQTKDYTLEELTILEKIMSLNETPKHYKKSLFLQSLISRFFRP